METLDHFDQYPDWQEAYGLWQASHKSPNTRRAYGAAWKSFTVEKLIGL